MTSSPLLVSAAGTTGELVVTPEDAGWTWCGLELVHLAAGATRTIRTGPSEIFVVPLHGSVTVSVVTEDGNIEDSFALQGRESVFTAVTDFGYVGRDSVIELTADQPAEVALPAARCERRLPARYGPAAAVPVEVRGAGIASRQVTNFGVPGVWEHAERLISCEVLTPGGNWSSYPAHKHDRTEPCPVADEEIYYYRIAGPDQLTPSRAGFGLHRTYTGPEHEAAGLTPLDEFIEVRDGDIVLIPYGYHGPVAAAPGYDMYYLNVLAGPAAQRSMAFCDDPAHAWLRDTWAGEPVDPRCPLTTATGRPDGRRLGDPSASKERN